jgi:mono/diheme cytochrome c family protein
MTGWDGRKQIYVVFIPAALLAVATVAAIYFQIGRVPATRNAKYVMGNPARGAELFYGDKQCGICHSVNGAGGRIAPDLTGTQPQVPAMGWLVAAVWNHGPGMWRQIHKSGQPFPQLDPQDMADLLAFLYQTSSIDRPGNASAGQKVFKDKGCSQCHSIGEGGNKGPDLSVVAQGGDADAWSRAMLNHAASMVGPITSSLGAWPQFSGTEMNDLIAYATTSAPQKANQSRPAAGNAERGWVVFQSRCMQCHAVRGHGGAIGPELGPDHYLPLSPARFASLMWNHAPAMFTAGTANGLPPTPLQGADMVDLVAFLASLRYYEPTGSPLIGEKVFALRGCAVCHGDKAQGTKLAPSLKTRAEAYTTASFTAALWRHGPEMLKHSEQNDVPWPMLQPADIGELVSFLNAPGNP